MKVTLVFLFGATLALRSSAQDIVFTNRTATFTNLEGKVFAGVTLVKGDLDGLIWRSEASGGRICYTNLHPDLLESWGISSNRIAVALDRAQHKAVTDARYRATAAAESARALRDYQQQQARWAAEQPARDREAQRQADLAQIQGLQQRIEAAKASLRHTEAAVSDANSANVNNPDAPYYYVKETARVEIEDAERQLARLEADYAKKYGKSAQ